MHLINSFDWSKIKSKPCFSPERGFSAIAQNPEFMAAIGKSFANQTLTLSKMVEEEDKDDMEMIFECTSCRFIMTEENFRYDLIDSLQSNIPDTL